MNQDRIDMVARLIRSIKVRASEEAIVGETTYSLNRFDADLLVEHWEFVNGGRQAHEGETSDR